MERKKILIVDDNDLYRLTCARYLEKNGWEIIEAQNGLEGTETAREKKPDLILMDVEMPVMSGFEALDKLKEDPDTQEIPVIIMSSDSYEKEALAHNCLFFEKSPVGFDDLLKLLPKI
jgi:CheY-like chemotaxis protein